MKNFNNRILITTALLTFSFIATAGAQTLISGGTTESGSSTTSTCEMPPSCESLGYTKTADDCANKVTLKCPLDESKLYCADARQNGVCSNGYSEIEKLFLTVPETMRDWFMIQRIQIVLNARNAVPVHI